MSPAAKSRGGQPKGGQPRRSHCEPSKHTQVGQSAQTQGAKRTSSSDEVLFREPRGVRSAFAGWDLGRNDHTDEVGRGRPAELAIKSLRQT